MKFKTTAKAIRNEYGKNRIVSIGYCEAQHIMNYFNPYAYTAGIYGWNFDVYELHGVAICTGYRGMPAGLEYDYDALKALDKKAASIRADYRKPYSEAKEEVEKLLFQFIDETREANK